jgi:hypothetical protein
MTAFYAFNVIIFYDVPPAHKTGLNFIGNCPLKLLFSMSIIEISHKTFSIIEKIPIE